MYGNFTLYAFAKSGATCSNYLTYRPFPPVFEYQLPLYFTEKYNGSLELDPASTIYTLWIGTNDVGVNALITGSQTPGVTLVDTIGCAVEWVKVLYTSGARNFVFQNVSLIRSILEGYIHPPCRCFPYKKRFCTPPTHTLTGIGRRSATRPNGTS